MRLLFLLILFCTSKILSKYIEIPFQRYLNNFDDFFERAGGRLQDDTPYAYNANVSESSNYQSFIDHDNDSYPVPTILLIDYTIEAASLGRPGVSEVVFGVDGNTKYEKADLLMKMWNHTTNDSTNKFSEAYNKN